MAINRLNDSHKAKIAAGRLAGKKDRVIAQELGCSLSTVDHADVRTIMRQFADANRAHLSRLYTQMLTSLEADLGKAPDYATRASLRGEVARVIALADGAVRESAEATGGDTVTLAELLKAYRGLDESRLIN